MPRYYKGKPNIYAIAFKNGKVKKHGAGINFWYLPLTTTLAEVPLAGQDSPFIFTEITADYQEVALQGHLRYRLTEPLTIAQRLDLTIEPKTGRYKQHDADKLVQAVVHAIQVKARDVFNALALEKVLNDARLLSEAVFASAAGTAELKELGIELEVLHFTSIKATPKMQKALEAEYRENLNKRADQAIYDRRVAAAAEERKLREGEMNTDIELENRRKELVDTQARNNLALAEADAKADEMRLNPYGELPPQALVGLALKEFAGNAGSIGNLTITPDLLERVVGWISKARH